MSTTDISNRVICRCIDLPANIRVGYKIFPGNKFEVIQGQSAANWSALYAQLSLPHAIAYLPNHFDRGCERASLVSLTSKHTIKCYAYLDSRFGSASITSQSKAQLLRDSIKKEVSSLDESKPLLQGIGEDLNMFTAIVDAEEIEFAIPHCFMNHDNFDYETLATFSRDPQKTWFVSSVEIPNKDKVVLRKDEKEDMTLLSSKVESLVNGVRCNWLDDIIEEYNIV